MADEHHHPDPLKFSEANWRGRSSGPDASLDKAIKDAWENRQGDPLPDTLRIIDIYVAGHNPISEYSVIVTRGN